VRYDALGGTSLAGSEKKRVQQPRSGLSAVGDQSMDGRSDPFQLELFMQKYR